MATAPLRVRSASWLAAAVIAAPLVLGMEIQGTAATHIAAPDPASVVLRARWRSDRARDQRRTRVLPGKVSRADTLNPSGTEYETVTLTTEATATSLLDSDPVDGLQLSIHACSVRWQREGIGEALSFSCHGEATLVLAARAVIGAAIPLDRLSVTQSGGVDYLRLTLLLPASTDNRFPRPLWGGGSGNVPALLGHNHDRVVGDLGRFIAERELPVVRCPRGGLQEQIARPYQLAAAEGRTAITDCC